MDKDKYTCAVCKNTYEKGWSDQEQEKEMKEIWGDIPKEDRAIICDDCFKNRTPKETKEMGKEYQSTPPIHKDKIKKATKEISKTFGRAIKRLGEAEWECECGEKVLPNERHTCKEEEREQSGFTRGLRLEKKAMKILDELMGKGNWEAKELNLIKSFAHAEIEKAKHTQLKEVMKTVEKYQEQFHGGGNGRRLFIQLLSELKEL